MAQFYGEVKGSGFAPIHRVGTKKTGLESIAASYEGGIRVVLTHDEREGRDYARIESIRWPSRRLEEVLFEGPLSLGPEDENEGGDEDGDDDGDEMDGDD